AVRDLHRSTRALVRLATARGLAVRRLPPGLAPARTADALLRPLGTTRVPSPVDRARRRSRGLVLRDGLSFERRQLVGLGVAPVRSLPAADGARCEPRLRVLAARRLRP